MANYSQLGWDAGSNAFAVAQERARKTAAYNALRAVYGDLAGDPEAATTLNALQQSQAAFPKLQQNRDLVNSGLQQTQDFAAQDQPYKVQSLDLANQTAQQGIDKSTRLAPYDVPKVQADIANTNATADKTKADTTSETLKQPYIAQQAQAQIARDNALAAEAAQRAEKLRQDQASAKATAAIPLVQQLIDARDSVKPVPGLGVRSDSVLLQRQHQQAIAQKLADPKFVEELKAFATGTGTPPDQIAQVLALAQSNPAILDKYLEGMKATAGGGADAETEAYARGVLNGTLLPQNVPLKQRGKVMRLVDSQPPGTLSPVALNRQETVSKKIVDPYLKQPGYTLMASAIPTMQRIAGALQSPGSVSDQELIDAMTKLSTGGNVVTENQVKLLTGGRTYADYANVMQKRFSKGGTLSDDQRRQIKEVSAAVFENYRRGYEAVYAQATARLKAANVPKEAWTIPDLASLAAGTQAISGTPTPAVSGWSVVR